MKSSLHTNSWLLVRVWNAGSELTELREPLVITQNGEATAVMQDVASYEQTQETLALLKILALGNRQIEQYTGRHQWG